MRMRKYYPVAVLLILLAAIALSASLVTTNANALPTFTTAVGGIGPCDSCHGESATHTSANHTTLACSSCHLSGTATPPTPVACAACHGGTSAILVSATHVTTKCGTTAGCHGAVSAATITSFAPTSGPVGTVVTLTGTGFTGATAVNFNGTTAAIFSVVSATQITATVPSGATTGTISVTPLSGPDVISATSFTVTVLPAVPTITSFAPTSAPVGTVVTLTGTGFTGATAVAFNGTTTAIFVVVSATQITAEVPSGATTGTIAVTTPGGTGTSATSFTVTVPAVTTKVTLKVAPTSIRFRRTVKATGAVTPVLALVGSKVALKAQIKKGTRWVTTKSVTATVKASGAYSWTYKPAKRGTYRMQASIKATATKRASHSPWRTFKVR
jgi:IPT/TIG domain